MLSREIISPKFSISSRHFEQVFNGQAAKRDVIPSNLNLAGSLKCSWLSNKLSSFSCLVSQVKMPSCSAPGCSNRSDKDPEKRLSFHNLPFRNKKFAKKWLDQLRRDSRFMTKKLENVYVCNEHFTEDCYEVSYRYEMLGAKTRKRRLKQDAVPKIFQRKLPLKSRILSERRIAQRERTEVSATFMQFSPAAVP